MMRRTPDATLVIVLLLAAAGLAQAAILEMPALYSTIQAAEDAAQPGDTILVRSGE